MGWSISFTERAGRTLSRLDRPTRRRIISFLEERVAPLEDPRQIGSALSSRFAGLWRYRVGDYRIVCRIEDDRLLILVVTVGHRREVYR